MRTLLAASLFVVSYADSRNLFVPAVNSPAVTAPASTAGAFSTAVAPLSALEASYHVQPLESVQSVAYVQSDSLAWPYAAAGALVAVGALTVAHGQRQTRVADLDLESANSAARVAMLFSSGRSAKPKPSARGKKAAPAKRGSFGGAKKKPAARAAAAVDDEDLFVHTTNLLEKSSDSDCFLNRQYQ